MNVTAAIFTLASLACSCTRKRNLKRQSNMIVLVTKIRQKKQMLQKQNFTFIYDAYRHYKLKELKFCSVDLLSALKG
jgi:hypothetical protein